MKIETIKLCPLCQDSPECPFKDIDCSMHEKFENHKTGNLTWRPEGESIFKHIHNKTIKLLDENKKLRDINSDLNKKIREFNSLKWYKKIFYTFDSKN